MLNKPNGHSEIKNFKSNHNAISDACVNELKKALASTVIT